MEIYLDRKLKITTILAPIILNLKHNFIEICQNNITLQQKQGES